MSKKTVKAIGKLHHIRNNMEYFYSPSQFHEFKQDFAFIEELLLELSADKKVDHARLAEKFKGLFFQDIKKLNKENKKLKKENKDLKDGKAIST
jgi:hypothetical protein